MLTIVLSYCHLNGTGSDGTTRAPAVVVMARSHGLLMTRTARRGIRQVRHAGGT